MSYLTKFYGVIYSGFWVIPKITSASLCTRFRKIINYSTSKCPFKSEKCGMEGKNYKKNIKNILRTKKLLQ